MQSPAIALLQEVIFWTANRMISAIEQ